MYCFSWRPGTGPCAATKYECRSWLLVHSLNLLNVQSCIGVLCQCWHRRFAHAVFHARSTVLCHSVSAASVPAFKTTINSKSRTHAVPAVAGASTSDAITDGPAACARNTAITEKSTAIAQSGPASMPVILGKCNLCLYCPF